MNLAELTALYQQLKPICRSITGEGYRQSLKLLSQYLPFTPLHYHSGQTVLDWTVPPDWTLVRARLWALDETKSQERLVLDSNDTAMYVLNFSEPFSGIVSRDELEPHLYSYPALPDAIPYVTSYYKPRWGLCLSQLQHDALDAPFYRVEIDVIKSSSRPEDGVTVGEYVLPATSNPEHAKTVLISAYLCHSCMLNNELSGPLVQLMLYEHLKALPQRRYNYRFVINPETIGSLCYLSDHDTDLAANLEYGLVLTCLATQHDQADRPLSFKLSRADWVAGLQQQSSPYTIDRFLRYCSESGITCARSSGMPLSYEASAELERISALSAVRPYLLRNFSPNAGSDERQYCSPYYNFPVVQVSRCVYGTYPQYHTASDDETIFSLESLFTSAAEIFTLLVYYELTQAQVIYAPQMGRGEPQLGKRNLYPSINSRTNRNMSNDSIMDGRNLLNLIRYELSLADGKRSLFELASQINEPLSDVWSVYHLLRDQQLVTERGTERAAHASDAG